MAKRMFQGPTGRARLVFAALLTSGVAFSTLAGIEWRRIERAETRFVPATGTIETLSMPYGVRPVSGGVIRVYDPQVTFRYQVNGVTYTSDRVAVRTPVIEGKAEGEKFEDLYAPGNSCTCYHDPDDPADGVLLRESSREEFARFGLVGGGCLGMALIGGGLYWGLAGKSAVPLPRQVKPRPVGRFQVPDDVPTYDPLARSRQIMNDHKDGYENPV